MYQDLNFGGQPSIKTVHDHHHYVHLPEEDIEKDDHANTVIAPNIDSTTVILPPKPDDEEEGKFDHNGEDVSDKRTFTVFLNGKPLGKYC